MAQDRLWVRTLLNWRVLVLLLAVALANQALHRGVAEYYFAAASTAVWWLDAAILVASHAVDLFAFLLIAIAAQAMSTMRRRGFLDEVHLAGQPPRAFAAGMTRILYVLILANTAIEAAALFHFQRASITERLVWSVAVFAMAPFIAAGGAAAIARMNLRGWHVAAQAAAAYAWFAGTMIISVAVSARAIEPVYEWVIARREHPFVARLLQLDANRYNMEELASGISEALGVLALGAAYAGLALVCRWLPLRWPAARGAS